MADNKIIVFKSSHTEISIRQTPEGKWSVFVNEKPSTDFSLLNFDSENEAREKVFSEIYSEKQQEYFKRLLLLENVMVLAGAGSSIVGEEGGKTMRQLWSEAEGKIDLVSRMRECGLSEDEQEKVSGNLEFLLSALSGLLRGAELEGNAEKAQLTKNFISDIEKEIAESCKIIVNNNFPHENFVRNILKARKKGDSRIKIFSLNYDTCFEQVADNLGGIVIDGFNFSNKPEFSSNNFDCDVVKRENNRVHSEYNYVDNIFHLYKLHGSVNWKKEGDKISKFGLEVDEPFLIYPGNQKFETTYETPFFELLSRFQKSLSEKNSLLLIVGYSFGDKHINQVIFESIKSNVNLHVLILNREIIQNSSTDSAEQKRYELYQKVNNGFRDLAFIAGNSCFSDFVKNMPAIHIDSIEEQRKKIFEATHD